MKRIALITILLSLACGATAHAQSRGYTSTQTSATGGGGGSLDSIINGTKKKTTDADSEPVKPKEKVYVQPTRTTKSKSVKDDRAVVVTKDAISTNKPIVKAILPPKLDVPSNRVRASVSTPQKANSLVDQTQFSPLPKSPQ